MTSNAKAFEHFNLDVNVDTGSVSLIDEDAVDESLYDVHVHVSLDDLGRPENAFIQLRLNDTWRSIFSQIAKIMRERADGLSRPIDEQQAHTV